MKNDEDLKSLLFKYWYYLLTSKAFDKHPECETLGELIDKKFIPSLDDLMNTVVK